MWDRHVIDDDLRLGYAMLVHDLDNDGDEELIIGVRDDPTPKEKVTGKRGVRIYEPLDGVGAVGHGRSWRMAMWRLKTSPWPTSTAMVDPTLWPSAGKRTTPRIYWNEGR